VTEAHNLPKLAQQCPARSQTFDLLITSPTFYQLSYTAAQNLEQLIRKTAKC